MKRIPDIFLELTYSTAGPTRKFRRKKVKDVSVCKGCIFACVGGEGAVISRELAYSSKVQIFENLI